MLATHVSMFTFLCDVLLVGSLSYVLITWWRAPGFATWSRHAADIDSLLKKAVREADVATKILGERLTGEKTSVERILIEVEDAKERLTKLLATAEAIENGTLGQQASQIPTQQASVKNNFDTSLSKEVERIEDELCVDDVATPVAVSAKQAGSVQKAAKKRVNIYGEEISDEPAPASASSARSTAVIGQARSAIQAYAQSKVKSATQAAAPTKRVGLAAQIERQRYDSHEIRAKGLEEAIADAEKLIRKGAPVSSVVESTQMAEEDVKMISRAISEALKKDMEEEEVTPELNNDEQSELDKILEKNREAHAQVLNSPQLDPRLGVLSKGGSRISATV